MDQTGHKMTGKSTVRDKRSALELAVLFAGICGLLLVIRPIPHVFFREGVVFPVILAVCFSMYILFGIRRKWLFIEIAFLFICLLYTSNLLGLEKIPSDSITLTPALFKK